MISFIPNHEVFVNFSLKRRGPGSSSSASFLGGHWVPFRERGNLVLGITFSLTCVTVHRTPARSFRLHSARLVTAVRRDAPVQALGCFATVTAEPAQNGPILFNEKLSCFSEMTEQNCKSCSQSLSRGENLDLHLEPKPPPHPTPPPTHTHRTKGL